MDDDEYELLPKKELARLKADADESRKKSALPIDYDAIEQLTAAVRELTELFKEAAYEMRKEPDSVKEISQRYDIMIDQNKKIAAGILALAELMRKHLPEISRNTAESSRRLLFSRKITVPQTQPGQTQTTQVQFPVPPQPESRLPPFPGNF